MTVRVVSADTSVFTQGIYDADGSIRIRESDGTPRGIYDTDGAFRVTVSDGTTQGLYAPDGSYYITDQDFWNGAMRVVSDTDLSTLLPTYVVETDGDFVLDDSIYVVI